MKKSCAAFWNGSGKSIGKASGQAASGTQPQAGACCSVVVATKASRQGSGFVRVRHYGLLANRSRAEKLEQCRRLLWQADVQQRLEAMIQPGQPERSGQRLCPLCGVGLMEVVEVLPAVPRGANEQRPDSS
jgi:hypothetical protein